MAIAGQRMTLEEFLKLPEEEPPLEFLYGEVTQKVSPKWFHSATQTRLLVRLEVFCVPRKLGRAFSELRTTYEDISTIPDVVYFVQERIPYDADGNLPPEALLAPDIAVEVVSPDQSVTDLVVRCLWYVANGVKIALLIDPDRRSVILFRPGREPIAVQDTGTLDLGDVIPGFALDVADLFSALQGS